MPRIITVENVSKRFQIGKRQVQGTSLRDTISGFLRAPLSLARRNGHLGREEFWALKDISFTVEQGEVVGIVGSNGAGKSTLLKILSRITEPTTGRIELYGRVASLLEVGTGFHPELTGRENIYLNGSILGMTRREIERKFDEIVAFAEIDKFIDTPVKRYSSGMYVRLAFAVAAHLEPEILIVDEVLAVGDTAFQKKCLGKMGDVAKQGRTVLFVSHNIGAIGNLCSRAILLNYGEKEGDGPTGEILEKYINEVTSATPDLLLTRVDRGGDGRIRFNALRWENSEGDEVHMLRSGTDYKLVLSYECPDGQSKDNVGVSFGIRDFLGNFLLLHQTDFSGRNFQNIPARGDFVCEIPKFPLVAGQYSLNIHVGVDGKPCDDIEDAARVIVEYGDFFGTGHPGRPGFSKILIECGWELQG